MLWQLNSYIFSISTEVISYVFRKKYLYTTDKNYMLYKTAVQIITANCKRKS